jgi:hypothetical protein
MTELRKTQGSVDWVSADWREKAMAEDKRLREEKRAAYLAAQPWHKKLRRWLKAKLKGTGT